MKRTKPKKQKNVTIRESDIKKLQKDAIDKACLIFLAAMVDEIGCTEEQMCNTMERTQRYACYIDQHIAQMSDIRNTIEKNTGIKMKGWLNE